LKSAKDSGSYNIQDLKEERILFIHSDVFLHSKPIPETRDISAYNFKRKVLIL